MSKKLQALKLSCAGPDPSKFNRAYLASTMLGLGLPVSETESIDDLVERAEEHFAPMPDDKIGKCDNCGGVSLLTLPACAFCGVGEDGVPPAAVAPQPAAKKLVSVNKRAEAIAITPLQSSSEVQTEATLDAAVARIRKAQGVAHATMWQLGREIGNVKDTGLWQLRKSEDGGPKFKSFDAFCRAELSMGFAYASRLIRVSREFDEQQFRELGAKKCQLLVQVSDEDRAELEKTAGGKTVAEVERQVRGIKQATGYQVPSLSGKKMPNNVARPRPPEPPPPEPQLGSVWIKNSGEERMLGKTHGRGKPARCSIPFENGRGSIEVGVTSTTDGQATLEWKVVRLDEDKL